jgi:hypothetical protein
VFVGRSLDSVFDLLGVTLRHTSIEERWADEMWNERAADSLC